MRCIVTEERSGIIQKDNQNHSELIFVCNNNHLEVVNTVSVSVCHRRNRSNTEPLLRYELRSTACNSNNIEMVSVKFCI